MRTSLSVVGVPSISSTLLEGTCLPRTGRVMDSAGAVMEVVVAPSPVRATLLSETLALSEEPG